MPVPDSVRVANPNGVASQQPQPAASGRHTAEEPLLQLRRTPSPSRLSQQQQQQHHQQSVSSPKAAANATAKVDAHLVSPPPLVEAPAVTSSQTPPPHPHLEPTPVRTTTTTTASASATSSPVPALAQPPPRSSIVDSSGFYYTTRSANAPAPLPSANPVAHETLVSAPHTAAAATVPLRPFIPPPPPSPSPALLFQQQQQQQHPHPHSQSTLLLPAPYDRPPSPSPSGAAPAPSHSLIPYPSPSRPPGDSQWQLSSPQERAPAGYDGHHRGAVFDYASEAVNTLELQYGDALQRLSTMHRLYDRLDEQNKTLEAEVARLRHTNDLLEKGVAFSIYNRVRQVKHEMKLLRQYVAVLCSGFRSSVEALQQVVAEDVPRLLGKGSGYTALLPYGAQGRLRSMETRVSVGRSSNQQDAAATPPLLPQREWSNGHSDVGGVSAAAEMQLYQPDYWWNAMSSQPLRPPKAQAEEVEESAQHRLTDASGVDEAHGTLWGGSPVRTSIPFHPGDRDLNTLFMQPQQQQQQQQEGGAFGTVSFQAFRQVQTALAEAQRRVVELEQQNSRQEADYEARVAQLKVAHKAREARLEEELALLKRIEPLTVDSDPAPLTTVTSAAGVATSGAKPSLSVDIHALAQLLATLQQQQQQQTQSQNSAVGSASSTCATGNTQQPCTVHIDAAATSSNAAGDDDGMVDSHDPYSGSGSSSVEDDANFDFYYGDGDVRHSYERTNRRVLQAAVVGRNHRHAVRGDDNRLHQPDRYSMSAAARRAERARQVLGDEAKVEEGDEWTREGEEERQRRQRHHASHSLAYERLVDQHDVGGVGDGDVSGRGSGRHNAPSLRSEVGKANPHAASRGRSHQRTAAAEKRRGLLRHTAGGEGDKKELSPRLLQSVLQQLSYNGGGGWGVSGSTYADKASRASETERLKTRSKADRLAQGLWAEELLKERRYI
jgi:hypothetical protein